jgi:hypothetical protein
MRTALAATAMLLLGLVAAQAFLGPQFCATQFQSPRSEVKQGMRMLAMLARDGRTLFKKETSQQWVSCICPKGEELCDCCEHDLAKVCAELERLSRMTMDKVHSPACEQGHQ